MDARVAGGSSSSRPRSRTWTPCARSSAVSLRIALLEEPEQPDDLLVGARPVLAAEGVQREHRDARVRTAWRSSSRIASTPAAWPSSSEAPRARAQRRLPSMMIATWRGPVGARPRRRRGVGGGLARHGAAGAPISCARGGASVGRISGARATRPRGPPAPWPRRRGRPRRRGGRSSSAASRGACGPRRCRPRRPSRAS